MRVLCVWATAGVRPSVRQDNFCSFFAVPIRYFVFFPDRASFRRPAIDIFHSSINNIRLYRTTAFFAALFDPLASFLGRQPLYTRRNDTTIYTSECPPLYTYTLLIYAGIYRSHYFQHRATSVVMTKDQEEESRFYMTVDAETRPVFFSSEYVGSWSSIIPGWLYYMVLGYHYWVPGKGFNNATDWFNFQPSFQPPFFVYTYSPSCFLYHGSLAFIWPCTPFSILPYICLALCYTPAISFSVFLSLHLNKGYTILYLGPLFLVLLYW